MRFEAGRIVSVTAGQGQSMLQQLVSTDEGAARLGEVALVPHNSPVAQSGVLFYNTLFDENAASHVAVVFLLISFSGPLGMPTDGATKLVLGLMHTVAGVIITLGLTRPRPA